VAIRRVTIQRLHLVENSFKTVLSRVLIFVGTSSVKV
jgi:hypothetical protein